MYEPHGSYGLQFPVQRVPGSRWVVVGETWCPEHSGALRHLQSVDIHYDADDPNHVFLGPEAWAGWPNARKLNDWYNARHRRNIRMYERRMVRFTGEDGLRIENWGDACAALRLSEMIRADPDNEHQAGRLEWSPSTQVWRDGERWVKVRPADLRGWA
jgi:hypothetical protein